MAYPQAMATSAGPDARRRLGRADWERAALAAIARGGLAAVAVEPLARDLGVTKGSFYAHFATRDELLAATLARWEAEHDAGGLAALAPGEDPAARLRGLVEAAVAFTEGVGPSPHVALLGELHDPRVRAALARVNASRTAYLAELFRALGLPPARARDRAQVTYAAFLGLLQLRREGGEADGARPRRPGPRARRGAPAGRLSGLSHGAQVAEGAAAAQLLDELVQERALVEAAAVGDGRDQAALALQDRGHRLVDRPRGQQVQAVTASCCPIRWQPVLGLVVHAPGSTQLEEGDVRGARRASAPARRRGWRRRAAAGPSGSWKARTVASRAVQAVAAQQVQRVGKRSITASCASRWRANTTSGRPRPRKSWIQARAAWSLPRAARRWSGPRAAEALGAQRRGDAAASSSARSSGCSRSQATRSAIRNGRAARR